MPEPSESRSLRAALSRRRFAAGASAAALVTAATPLRLARAQSASLKVGVLLPRSGAQASIGQDCQRGVELAPPIFKELGLPELTIVNTHTTTNLHVPRP